MSEMPRTEEEWFMAGVVFGWQTPMCTAEAPAPLADNYLEAYFRGVQAGGEARLAAADEGVETPSEMPEIGPTPGGSVPLEEALSGQREILEELFHQHMPHVDVPEYEPWYPPLGGMIQQPVP
ncbi:hypothetical protein [Planotetraspora mira]|uniref:Uncharacterized protein n=1 Tax=Planotetraspora mira TaxID=58121 RepID=A0A8J3TTK2_9ACTN|nr:hypothetical protein [Planotetraspora mira]GII31892.1 hypothetical protein Pmi06nite_53340 [Planotetraspora mira]